MLRMCFAAAAMALLTACASAPVQTPVNVALAANAPQPAPAELAVEGNVIALSFSGGGARAAAFSLGVLQGLREMRDAQGAPLVNRVALITAVSGGAITASYYGQHGPAGLDTFRAAYLDKDWEAELHTSAYSPANWMRAYQGGVNDRALLADWLDTEVFAHGAMRDLNGAGQTRIWVNALELYNGTPFAFTPVYFQALCSDLGSVRIADAVAASMTVPLAFRPTVLETHPEACTSPLPAWVSASAEDRAAPALLRATARALQAYRDPARMRYLHLVDGGVADNFGLSTLTVARRAAGNAAFAPLSPRDAVRVRRMVFLVVNAEMGESGDWPLRPEGPTGAEVLSAALDASIDFGKRVGYDAFLDMIQDWERDVRAYRCGLSRADVSALRGTLDGWDCNDVHFAVDMISFTDLPAAEAARLGETPTRVSLPAETVDALIAGGRAATLSNPAAQSLSR